MDLTSCSSCGVVLDKRRLDFPIDIENPDGSICGRKGSWNGECFVPFVSCPVCETEILKEEPYNGF